MYRLTNSTGHLKGTALFFFSGSVRAHNTAKPTFWKAPLDKLAVRIHTVLVVGVLTFSGTVCLCTFWPVVYVKRMYNALKQEQLGGGEGRIKKAFCSPPAG